LVDEKHTTHVVTSALSNVRSEN